MAALQAEPLRVWHPRALTACRTGSCLRNGLPGWHSIECILHHRRLPCIVGAVGPDLEALSLKQAAVVGDGAPGWEVVGFADAVQQRLLVRQQG